jgi:hypothetical protein
MKNKAILELADVKSIAAAAEAEALTCGWAVSIAVVDDGGNMLWLQRLDGAAPISALIAPAKARTSAIGSDALRLLPISDMLVACLLLWLIVCLFVCLFLFVCLIVCLFDCLFVCLIVCVFVFFFVSLFV